MSLFDNRYQYDHIYPRGRSGETLRAVDTHDQDRPVVIKRPAPQDAPPMRAAQEVSIATEKRALERLSGHPVLTELRGSGTFRAGGSTYHYIAMDRAEGEIVAEMVLDLAAHDQNLPELEMLIIVDRLLDLLAAAHTQHVIYNDVDAKHLFWNRDAYKLKVIDWGNAVFSDDANAQPGIIPANDIYQVGELLYFLYNRGARLVSETPPEGDYTVIFSQPVPEAIQNIITRATHPNIKNRRFPSIRSLRDALTAYRQPIERSRDQQFQSLRGLLTPSASQQTLADLETQLTGLLLLDPGFPDGRKLLAEVRLRLRQLAVQADFEATRIYLETGNWSRAIRLMEELIPDADPYMYRVLTFLVAAAEQLQRSGLNSLPAPFERMMAALLDGNIQPALNILLDENTRDQWQERQLIAECFVRTFDEMTLLRPHLVRLEYELQTLNPALSEQLDQMLVRLNAAAEPGLAPLLDRYGKLAIQLADLLPDLEPLSLHNPAERADAATRNLLQYLRRVGDTFYSQPQTAQTSLEQAQQIDPQSKAIAALRDYLQSARDTLTDLGSFRPDANTLENWFENAAASLAPYQTDLTDAGFLAISRILDETLEYWHQVGDMLIQGRQRPVVDRLRKMAGAIQPYNSHVAAWFENNARLVQDGTVIEKFAPNQDLADLLVEGYRAWDQGQSGRAADTARRGQSIANTPGEQLAIERLQKLADITNSWLNGGSVTDHDLTDQQEQAALALFLPDETAEYERFTGQMKSEDVYLKAMKLGIVAHMRGSSAAGYRALFIHYVLRGVMTIQEDRLEDADFWRTAALNTISSGQTHPLFSAMDTALTRRKLVLRAEEAINNIHSFSDLYTAKQVLNAPLAEDWLKDAQAALNQIEIAQGLWADGDFRGVRDAFNKALDSLTAAEQNGNMKLDPLRQWITPYRDRALELIEKRQVIDQAGMAGSLKPDSTVLRALEQIVDISEATMGADLSRQVRLWRDLYKTMLKTHLDQSHNKREKIAEFDINFSALFIDKHPAYRLFQRWYEAARALPEDVREDVQISVELDAEMDTTTDAPRYEEETAADEAIPPYLEETPDPYAEDDQPREWNWNWIIGGAMLVLLLLGGIAALRVINREDEPIHRFGATPTLMSAAVENVSSNTPAVQAVVPSETPIPPTTQPPTRPPATATPQPTDSPEPPTIAPTLTPSLEVTIMTNTPPPTFTIPAPTSNAINPNEIDAFRVLSLIQPDDYSWDAAFLSQGAGGIWQLGASVEEAGSAPIAVVIDPDFMEAFAAEAGTRLRAVTAQVELTFYDETRVENEQVFFGLGLQNNRRQRYAAQVQVESGGLVNLGVNQNGNFVSRSRIPMNPVEVTLSVQRSSDGSLVFFIDGQRVGDSPTFFPEDEPVSLVLYTAGGGMFVSVSALTLEFAP